jgi:hypothetical protein
MLPRLPDEVGGGSGKMLADGVQWASLSIQFPPEASLSLVIQSRDADAAAALRGMIVSAFQLLGKQPQVRQRWPQVDDVARLLTPRLSGEQLTLSISQQDGQFSQVLQLLVEPLQAARTSAGRAQSMNHLKQLGLALHNYHDAHGRFPPQAIRNAEGQALLSWRVAILPYLDAEGLYKEFHLDEPWDSQHNRKLIEKMPAVLASPHLGTERRAKGLTSYLAPLSRRPPTVALPPGESSGKPATTQSAPQAKNEMIFDRTQGSRIQDITDGTSNTILVLESHPRAAVTWTAPDDLVIDFKNLVKDLSGQPNDGFCTLLGDGSVHFLKTSLEPTTLLRLLQMNDGQPLGPIH